MVYSEETVSGIFHARAVQYQYEPCIRYKNQGTYASMSWKEMQNMVKSLGLALISLGVKKADRAAIFSENCWQWIIADLAVLSIGALDVPVYATSSAKEAVYIIKDSGSKVVFVYDSTQLDKLLENSNDLKNVQKIITFFPVETEDKNVISVDKLLQEGESHKDKGVFDKRLEALKPGDLATLMYTPGTTGQPKGVMLTHSNIVSNIMQCYASHPLINHGDESLALLPWAYSFGRIVSLYLMIHVGAVINLAENFSTVLQNMKEVRPTLVIGVPRFLEKLHSVIISRHTGSQHVQRRLYKWAHTVSQRAVDYVVQKRQMPYTLKIQYDLSETLVFSDLRKSLGLERLKFFICGGGPLSNDIDRFFNGMGIFVHNGYGLTETSPVVSVNRFETFNFGSVGPALADTRIKIAEDGEIMVKGPQVMSGYYNKSQETKDIFTEDGWLMTGDIGMIDDNGCLHITDRKKDIIITTSGHRITPQNIENVLASDPFIEQAVVIGEGRRFLSALMVPNSNKLGIYAKKQGISFNKNEDLIKKPEIISFYGEKVQELMKDFAPFEHVRKYILLPREFSIETGELTPTLKIKRKKINEKYSAEIERIYSDDG